MRRDAFFSIYCIIEDRKNRKIAVFYGFQIVEKLCLGDKMTIQTNQDLYARLWDGAEQLRGSMDASKYKDYRAPLITTN